jgi:hypothetical protein
MTIVASTRDGSDQFISKITTRTEANGVRETERESGEGEREEEQRGRIERENSEGE